MKYLNLFFSIVILAMTLLIMTIIKYGSLYFEDSYFIPFAFAMVVLGLFLILGIIFNLIYFKNTYKNNQ